jgi:hypothetical protein
MAAVHAFRPLVVLLLVVLAGSSAASAQSTKPDSPWSVDFGIGWDNGISGHVNASGIGEINDQVVVITKNSYEDVYGNGLHIRFGGGYRFREDTEVRATFTFQSLDADFVTPMGDIGVSNLYAQFSDYQTFSLDVGLRRYFPLREKIDIYGEGTIGIGFIDRLNVTLVAPGANLAGFTSDFYDQTAAFVAGGNVGVLFRYGDRLGFFGQVGLRWTSGLTEVDDLAGTGLEDINNKSSRWTFPMVVGVRYQF